ncbi:MAG: hypothetical protein ACYTG4_08755, partial [Planctomycetota bacterium]
IVRQNSEILPTSEDLHKFIRYLSDLERDSQVTITNLPKINLKQGRGSALTEIPVILSGQGTLRAFLRFLNALENHDRLVHVADFNVSPSGSAAPPGEDLVHDYTMNIKLYRYDEKAGSESEEKLIRNEVDLLKDTMVTDIIKERGKPEIERYQLLPGRENRRDVFVDPRPSVSRDPNNIGPDVDDTGEGEVQVVEALKLKLELCSVELEAYRNAEKSKDFLLMAATKRQFLERTSEFETDYGRVKAKNPPFETRLAMDRFTTEVERPYMKMMEDATKTLGLDREEGKVAISKTAAEGMKRDMKGLMDERAWKDAVTKWMNIDQLRRDAGRNVDRGAEPILDEINKMGEHAKFQEMLASKNLSIQGIIRMEQTVTDEDTGVETRELRSGVIVNGRTLFPGKLLDSETRFLRVEEGDRLIFVIQGHEVDHVPPEPELLSMESAILSD